MPSFLKIVRTAGVIGLVALSDPVAAQAKKKKKKNKKTRCKKDKKMLANCEENLDQMRDRLTSARALPASRHTNALLVACCPPPPYTPPAQTW